MQYVWLGVLTAFALAIAIGVRSSFSPGGSTHGNALGSSVPCLMASGRC